MNVHNLFLCAGQVQTNGCYKCQNHTFVCVKYIRFVSVGLWPSFQSWNGQQSAQQKTLDINLLDYFLGANHDGINVIWAHAVNDRDSLQQALYGIYHNEFFAAVKRSSA